jgi:hypothetical protein
MSRRLSGLVCLSVLLASAAPHGQAAAKQPARQPAPAPFNFAQGRISFLAPPGFTALTAAEIAKHFPVSPAPGQAVGNAERSATITYDLMADRAPATGLEDARKYFTSGLEQAVPNIKWVSNSVHRIGTRDWAHLEYTTPTVGRELHNIVLVGVYDGHALIFTFNSALMEFPRVEKAFRASMATITAKP